MGRDSWSLRSIVRILAPGVSKKSINLCLKNGPIPACFCLFLSFSHFNNANWKSIDDVLRIWTHGDRMEGEDDTTELWMPTKRASSLVGKKNFSTQRRRSKRAQNNPLLSKRFFWDESSVTRFGDFLHFGQLFKACGNNYFAQIAHIVCKGVKSFIFCSEIIFVQLLQTFGDFLLVTLDERSSVWAVRYSLEL